MRKHLGPDNNGLFVQNVLHKLQVFPLRKEGGGNHFQHIADRNSAC